MRINRFIAISTGISRRTADDFVQAGRVKFNGAVASSGQQVTRGDTVKLDDKILSLPDTVTTILLNKPVGYVCSRDGQGSRTVYDLLPKELHNLKPVGRLDKDSSGLLLMTNDGILANKLTHPSFQKSKQYEVSLDKELPKHDFEVVTKSGVQLEDGLSKLHLKQMDNLCKWQVTMHEGRNRQIRRTFSALSYKVIKLHRVQFGNFSINQLKDDSLFKLVH